MTSESAEEWRRTTLEKALVALDDVSFDVQTVVVVGKNERLERRLADVAQRLRHPVVVRGFVGNVCDYMRAADVLVERVLQPQGATERTVEH